MRTWSILFMLAIVALSGCADTGGDDQTDSTEDGDPGDGADGNQTDDGTGGDGTDGTSGDGAGDDGNGSANSPPTASLSSDIVNGTAPLNITITIDGSDADGDNLTWSLIQDGNETASGDTLPATVNATLEAGNHTFILAISDGKDVGSANLTITVADGTPMDLGPCGGEPEPCIIEEHPWVTVWSDGRCDAKGALGHEAGGWLHDRPGSSIPVVGGNPAGGDWPAGTGYISGGGTWLYEESNGIDGLQLNDNVSSIDGELGTDGFAIEKGCVGGDTMMF